MAVDSAVPDESPVAVVARQVLARALRRPLRVLAIALLVTGAVIVARAIKAPSYHAALYFLMAEGGVTDPSHGPRPLRSIREYISNVALSRNRLEQIMSKFHVSEAYRQRDRVGAIDSFREDIRVDISRNDFVYDRSEGDPPRSAQVTISLSGADAEKTRAILHEIGDAILTEQVARRSARLAQAREYLDAQLRQARADTKALQDETDSLWLGLAGADEQAAIGIRAQIAARQAEIKGAIERVIALERRAAAIEFGTAAEDQQLGLSFELFDESLIASAPRLTLAQLLRLAALVFAIALLLTVPVVGVFDDRVYVTEDLAKHGVPIFGALPRFPGDDVGSYRARMREKRV